MAAGVTDQEASIESEILRAIAVVDMSRIFRESEHIQAHRELINRSFIVRENEIELQVDRREELAEELRQEQLGMTEAQLVEHRREMDRIEVKIQRDNRDLNDDKRLAFNTRQRELEKTVINVVAEVAAENRNYVVLELSAILFAEESVDITDEVISMLDGDIDRRDNPE